MMCGWWYLRKQRSRGWGVFFFVLNHLLSPPVASHRHSYDRHTSGTPLTCGPIFALYFPPFKCLDHLKTPNRRTPNRKSGICIDAGCFAKDSCEGHGFFSPNFPTQLSPLQLAISNLFFLQLWNPNQTFSGETRGGISKITMNIWNAIACHHGTNGQKMKLPFFTGPLAGRVTSDKTSNFTQVILLRPWSGSNNSCIFQPILRLWNTNVFILTNRLLLRIRVERVCL